MLLSSHFKRRRADRHRRILDRAAVRAEFELDPPQGWRARLRAYAQSVEDLERARIHAHLWARQPRATPAPSATAAPASDAAPKRTARR